MADTVENTTDAAQKTGSDEKPPKAKREFNKVALGILAATAVAITVSIYFTLQFIDKERERDLLMIRMARQKAEAAGAAQFQRTPSGRDGSQITLGGAD